MCGATLKLLFARQLCLTVHLIYHTKGQVQFFSLRFYDPSSGSCKLRSFPQINRFLLLLLFSCELGCFSTFPLLPPQDECLCL